MAYQGEKYEHQGRPQLRSEKGGTIRDIIYILGTLGAAGTLAAIVIGTTVLGGGTFLLVISPLLLLFSPILVPLAIATTVLGGGALALAVGTAGTIGAVSWLWNYFAGRHPYGAESVDQVTGRVKGAVEYGQHKASEMLGYGQQRGQEALQYGQQKVGDVMGYGQQKTQEMTGWAQQKGQEGQQQFGRATEQAKQGSVGA